MRFALIISLVLALLAVVFALRNPGSMTVNLGFWEVYGSTALILMATFGLGVLVGILATVPTMVRRGRRVKALQRESSATASLGKPYTSDVDYTPSTTKHDPTL